MDSIRKSGGCHHYNNEDSHDDDDCDDDDDDDEDKVEDDDDSPNDESNDHREGNAVDAMKQILLPTENGPHWKARGSLDLFREVLSLPLLSSFFLSKIGRGWQDLGKDVEQIN